MTAPIACHWSPTGYSYERPDGGCSCRPASPPDVVLYDGELAALQHLADLEIATVLDDDVKLAELGECTPLDYERLLASATAKLGWQVAP